MKKAIILILVLAITVCLVGCGGETSTSSEDVGSQDPVSSTASDNTSSTDSTSKDSGVIELGNAELSVGMEFNQTIMNRVGTPDDIMSAPSCYFDGEDTIYVYEDFSLYTYRDGDKDILYIIELSDSSNQTALGAKVGMTVEQIEELYGYDSTGTATSKVYKLDETSKLRFTYDETETVTLIEYELIG